MGTSQGYDYVIVGAGSAGCVLANRLSADPACRVLLLEAGGRDLDPLIHVPLGLGKLHEYRLHDWRFVTEPVPGLDGRTLEAARGKVLGGSSSINVMAFTRGNPGDYDRWARNGATGWSWDAVLPYFRRVESWVDGASELRGGDGPISVEWGRSRDPLFDAWIEAGEATGVGFSPDYNGATQAGIGRGQYSIRNGRRCSAAVGYLRPARGRPNLEVLTRAHATRLTFDGGRASGVEYLRRGHVEHVTAGREVIVSGGTFSTPPLLLRSGIGPAAELARHGIPVRVDAPVGENLQDHLAVLIYWSRPRNTSRFRDDMRFDRMALGMLRAWLFGTGHATVVPGGLHAFVHTQDGLDAPDLEFMFRGLPAHAHMWFPGVKRAYPDGYGIRPAILHPASRGSIRLRSADPLAPPRIFYDFLSAPGDLETLRAGLRLGREIGARDALAPYRGVETAPGPDVTSDADIDAYIRRSATTVHHPCGTCAMGGEDRVLDPELRVRGVEGLRVVDASAMPDLASGHINACVLMMAERAADLIAGTGTGPAVQPAPGRATSPAGE